MQPQQNKYSEFIKKARSDGISDYDIYNYLKEKGEFASFTEQANNDQIPEKQQRAYIGEKIGLNTMKPRNMLQEVISAFAGPIPDIAEYLGTPFSEELTDIRGLPGAGLASIAGLPEAVMNLPHNLMEAQADWMGKPELKKYAPPKLTSLVEKPIQEYLGNKNIKFPGVEEFENLFIAEEDQPKTKAGEFAKRLTQFIAPSIIAPGAGATTAARAGGGATLGGLDYLLEQSGRSPAERAIAPFLFGVASAKETVHPSPPPTAKGKPPPKPPRPPGAPMPPHEMAIEAIKEFGRKQIDDTATLAANILIRDPEKIDFKAIKNLKELGFDMADVPIQTYTLGGIPNLIEGAAENSFFSKKRWYQVIDKFSNEMINRFDSMLDQYPLQEISEKVTQESLGKPVFNNPLTESLEAVAPGIDFRKTEIGKTGLDIINIIDERMTTAYRDAFKNAKFKESDAILPNTESYNILKNAVNEVLKEAEGKGFIGGRQEVVNIAKKFKELFKKPKKKGEKAILLPTGEEAAPVEQKIKYDDLRKNLIAFNDVLNYENPEMINLAMPIANAIRQVYAIEAGSNPRAAAFLQAQNLFSQRARLFNDPVMRKMSKMTPEQIFNAMKKPHVLEALDNFARETNSVGDIQNLKMAFISKLLERPINAENAQELKSGINKSILDTVKEIEMHFPELPNLHEGLVTAAKFANEFQSIEGAIQGKIRQEAIEFNLTGDPPLTIFRNMESNKGIRLVKEALSGTEQGKKIYNNLARKKIETMLYNTVGKENVTLPELSQALKDQRNKNALKNLLDKKQYQKLEKLQYVIDALIKGQEHGLSLKKKAEYASYISATLGTLALTGVTPAGYGGAVALNGLARGLVSDTFRKKAGQRAEEISRRSNTKKSKKPKPPSK